jgi:alanine racemase
MRNDAVKVHSMQGYAGASSAAPCDMSSAAADAESMPAGYPGYLTIDLAALSRNYRAMVERVSPASVAAVVKADAYGLGADRVAPVLYASGCRHFFVAQFHEALAVLAAIGGDADVFVLNGLQPGNEGPCAEAGIVPVVNSTEQLAAWQAQAAALGRPLPAVLQFDTGMSRLGLAPVDFDSVLRALEEDNLDIRFVMSHLACADEPDNEQNAGQLAEMQRIAAAFANVPLCFANSGGSFFGNTYHGALVRPGIAVYGGAPHGNADNPMEPVVSLDVAVVQTRSVPEGAKIGYGGAHVAAREMVLATIAAGYADGLPRTLSDRGAVYFDGLRLPIVGRVSMDSIIVDATALPAGRLTLGARVEVIGPNQSLDALAADAGTISYEILTGLGRRYFRNYR